MVSRLPLRIANPYGKSKAFSANKAGFQQVLLAVLVVMLILMQLDLLE